MTNSFVKRAQKLGYSEDLWKGVVPPAVPKRLAALSDEQREIIADGMLDEVMQLKLDLLLRHYGLERQREGAWQLLAAFMAIDWIPGFEVLETSPRSQGAPKRVPELHLIDFFQKIEAIRKEGPRRKTVISACKTFMERRKNNDLWPGGNLGHHRNCYYRGQQLRERWAAQHEAVLPELLKGTTFDGFSGLFAFDTKLPPQIPATPKRKK